MDAFHGPVIANNQTGKCIEIINSNKADGAKLHQWYCSFGPNQLWDYTPQFPSS